MASRHREFTPEFKAEVVKLVINTGRPTTVAALASHDHYVRALANFRRLDLGEEQFMHAAQLRARHGLRTPDALHLAVAQLADCDQLWTNDNHRAAAAAARGLAVNVV